MNPPAVTGAAAGRTRPGIGRASGKDVHVAVKHEVPSTAAERKTADRIGQAVLGHAGRIVHVRLD